MSLKALKAVGDLHRDLVDAVGIVNTARNQLESIVASRPTWPTIAVADDAWLTANLPMLALSASRSLRGCVAQLLATRDILNAIAAKLPAYDLAAPGIR